MNRISKKILLTTGSTSYNIDLLLTNTFSLQGTYNELENNNSKQPNNNKIFLSGTTESYLDEVKTYDSENPYIIGVNGVINIVRDLTTLEYKKVDYIINNIQYTTDLVNNKTTYIFTGNTSSNYNDNFLIRKDDITININEKPRINNLINVERQELSVLDKLMKINMLKNIEDIDDLNDVNF